MPFAFGESADLAARLAQVFQEGYGECQEADFFLPWVDVYALLRHPELSAYRDALLIPPDTHSRPKITSKGALMDPDFVILLDEWVDQNGRRLMPMPELVGRVLKSDSESTLLVEPLHHLLDEMRQAMRRR